MTIRLFSSLAIFLFFTLDGLWANGVAIVNADDAKYFTLIRSEVAVRVENQVAITTTTQWFRNLTDMNTKFKYGFPMPSGASATALSWQIDNVWYDADFQSSPQDPSLPGGGQGGGTTNVNLQNYLGLFPLFFSINDEIAAGQMVAVKLIYVELLPYKFGIVTYKCPNDYDLIQSTPLESQGISWELSSSRLITSLTMPGFPGAMITNAAYVVSVHRVVGTAFLCPLRQPTKNSFFNFSTWCYFLGSISPIIFLFSQLSPDMASLFPIKY